MRVVPAGHPANNASHGSILGHAVCRILLLHFSRCYLTLDQFDGCKFRGTRSARDAYDHFAPEIYRN